MADVKYILSASFASPHPEATGPKINGCLSASGEEKQNEIVDSVNYAKRIQLALLASEKYIDKTLKKMMNHEGKVKGFWSLPLLLLHGKNNGRSWILFVTRNGFKQLCCQTKHL